MIDKMIENLKKHPECSQIGMVASHLGVVRGMSRDGEPVCSIEVRFDQKAIKSIIADIKTNPGIIDILVETKEGRLYVGEEIMAVAVAGDIREHVFDSLIEAVNRIKGEASHKREFLDNRP